MNRSRWPTPSRIGHIAAIYVTLAALAGAVAFVVMLGVAAPMFALGVALGIALAALAYRHRDQISAAASRLFRLAHLS